MTIEIHLTVEQLREAVIEYAKEQCGTTLADQLRFTPEGVEFDRDYDGAVEGVTLKVEHL